MHERETYLNPKDHTDVAKIEVLASIGKGIVERCPAIAGARHDLVVLVPEEDTVLNADVTDQYGRVLLVKFDNPRAEFHDVPDGLGGDEDFQLGSEVAFERVDEPLKGAEGEEVGIWFDERTPRRYIAILRPS